MLINEADALPTKIDGRNIHSIQTYLPSKPLLSKTSYSATLCQVEDQ